MLFFENYKNGLYGKFYGCVDPMSIMVSLREFTRWRSVRLDEIERGRVVEKAHRERMAWIASHKVLTNNEKSEI